MFIIPISLESNTNFPTSFIVHSARTRLPYYFHRRAHLLSRFSRTRLLHFYSSMMQSFVFCVRHYLKIFYSIVQFIAINMVHKFLGKKFPSKMLLHNISMLSSVFSVDTNKSISSRYPTIWSSFLVTLLASFYIFAVTRNFFSAINTCIHSILQTKSRHLPFRSSYLGMIIQRKVTTLCERIKNYQFPRYNNYIITTMI